MISMLHQSGRVGHGRPEHSGTSGVKNRLMKSGVAFGGGGKINNPFKSSTTKTSKKESGRITEEKKKEKKKEIVKKKKRRGFLDHILRRA